MYGWKQPCTFSKLIDQSTIELSIKHTKNTYSTDL